MLLQELLAVLTADGRETIVLRNEHGADIYVGSADTLSQEYREGLEVLGIEAKRYYTGVHGITAALMIMARKVASALEKQTAEPSGIAGILSVLESEEFVIIEHAPRLDGTIPTRIVPAECLPKWEAVNYRAIGRGFVEAPLYKVRDNIIATAEASAEHEQAAKVAHRMIEACKKAAAEFGINEEVGK